MSKKRLVISLYIMAVCLFILKVCCDHFADSAKGIETGTGYINSDGQLVVQSSGYYGRDSQKMENFSTLANICVAGAIGCLLVGTACLIFMHSGTDAGSHYSQGVRWVYDDGGPKDGWKCSKCGVMNARYTGTCSCGNTKPSM